MITVIDVETTGMEPGGVVEVAGVRLLGSHLGRPAYAVAQSLVNPGCAVEISAMAIHHITEGMVASAPSLDSILSDPIFGVEQDIVVAHHAAFDRKFLPSLAARRWICTWRCALHLWPDAPGHSNQELRYWLHLDMNDLPEEAGRSSHRALYDAWTTAKLLEREIDEVISSRAPGVDDSAEGAVGSLLELSSMPVVLRTVRFGKHRGMLWSDVPQDYLRWVSRQSDMGDDAIHTARHWLR